MNRADHTAKLEENEKEFKYLNLSWVLKKLWKMKVRVIPVVISDLGTVTKRLVQRHGNKRTNKDHLNYGYIRIGHNTEKSPVKLSVKIIYYYYYNYSNKSNCTTYTTTTNNNNNNRDLRKLAVTQTPVKDHQLTLM